MTSKTQVLAKNPEESLGSRADSFVLVKKDRKEELSTTSMSKYIVMPVKMAYPRWALDLDIHAHQVRGISASLAHLIRVILDISDCGYLEIPNSLYHVLYMI